MQQWCQVCVGYVQQSCPVETIRIVQRLNDPKRKSSGGTTETARQKILRSEKEGSGQNRFESRQWAEQVRVQAVSRAGLSPGGEQSRFESRRRAEQVRVQAAGRAGSSPGSEQSRFESRQ